jgi:flagellar basal-body rod protein FlgG
MMRSLWTAASGMQTQQTNVDTISNNLANINTTGYKKEAAQFKSLLYQTIQANSTDANGELKPVGIQAGLGVRTSAIVSRYSQGTLVETGNDYDFAIQGNGFFMIQMEDGSTGYTRNGSFGLSIGAEGTTLATAEGRPVLDTEGNPIVFPSDYNTSLIEVDDKGNFTYKGETGEEEPLKMRIGLAQFNNPAGMEKVSNSILKPTENSGEARLETEDPNVAESKVIQRHLEGSNVQAVNEMVDLIVAQRAYEMNSKTITASDEMLQQANNLRR